ALARAAHLERLFLHAERQVLDQLLSRDRPARHHHVDQPGGRSAARRAQSAPGAVSEKAARLDFHGPFRSARARSDQRGVSPRSFHSLLCFSNSAARKALHSSGEALAVSDTPCAWNCLRSSGSRTALTTSACRRSRISGGVPAGA